MIIDFILLKDNKCNSPTLSWYIDVTIAHKNGMGGGYVVNYDVVSFCCAIK